MENSAPKQINVMTATFGTMERIYTHTSYWVAFFLLKKIQDQPFWCQKR